MTRWHAFVFAVLALFALRAFGQDGNDSSKFFDTAQQQIADIRKQLGGEIDEARLGDERDVATSIAASADALAADRAPKLDALDARIAELGPAPAKPGGEAPDIAAQRADLGKQRATVDAEIKRANLLAVDARQLLDEIAEARRANFQARLSQRTPSPLLPTFWKNVAGSSTQDRARLGALEDGVVSAVKDAFAPDNRVYAIAGIVIGVLLIVLGRWGAERALMRLTADKVPHGRLRRSALALAVVVVATLFTGLGAQIVATGLDWHSAFTDAEAQLAHAIVLAVFFGGFVAGLGRALLSPSRPSWRLLAISDEVADALRPFPWLFGAAIALAILLRRINSIVGASLSATVAATFVSAVVYTILLIVALARLARARRHAQAHAKDKDDVAAATSSWANLAIGALWIAALVSLVAALTGYVAFAQFVVALVVRALIVGGLFALVVHFIEDLCFTLVSARTTWMQDTLGVRARMLDQLAVVLSGAFRVVAFLFALSLVFAGFGSGRTELSSLGSQIGSSSLKIGQIEITPDAVFGAIAVFLVGLLAVRALKRWLHDRYLPTTSLDPAMRSSVTTLLGYAGGIVVLAFALSELGLSLDRIAWVASALSVGIGFGLQAVVQNFVSGLILLVERPVKVGDWIALGDVEGDIRRINVRATEIQMGDRSTMIVPNSELITKTVRNVTLANAQGRVMVKLPMPLDTDADAVIAAMRGAFGSHARILAEPALSVTIDGIQNGALIFVGVAFIDNPRQAGGIRSDILLDVLARLREAGIPMVRPQEIAYRSVGQEPTPPGTPFETS